MSSEKKSAHLTILPAGTEVTVPAGTLLSDALAEGGYTIPMPCGGKGICGRCRVNASGSLSRREHGESTATNGSDGSFLACTTLITGDTTVTISRSDAVAGQSIVFPTDSPHYAFAADIGTTTVQVSVVDPERGEVYSTVSFLNPQRKYGHDVISRVSRASSPDERDVLASMIRKSLLAHIGKVSAESGITDRVRSLCISGNTAMTHLFLNLDPSPLGRFPYKPLHTRFEGYRCADIGFDLFHNAELIALPAVSGFLGGDFLGGLTLLYDRGFERNFFFIDIGTNGEMCVCGKNGGIVATSCAMGPALEGMNISYGMTASDGAITGGAPVHGRLALSVYGNKKAVGIAGTGLIALIAELVHAGAISPDGRIQAGENSFPLGCRIGKSGSMKTIVISDPISISQADIRALQLAKAASRSAAALMLRESGIPAEDISDVFISGAFGTHLDIEKFNALGFLPAFPGARYHFLGNTSLSAAERACIDGNFTSRMNSASDGIRVLDLSTHPDFNDLFIASIGF